MSVVSGKDGLRTLRKKLGSKPNLTDEEASERFAAIINAKTNNDLKVTSIDLPPLRFTSRSQKGTFTG